LWVIPRTTGGKPRWDQKQFSAQDRRGKLLPVVSSGAIPGTLSIDQDATIYVSSLAKGESVKQTIGTDRRAYLFVISGELKVNGTLHHAGDQARITDTAAVEIEATQDSELILLDLP
jgi:redox-sensitive bicupin YhaK (pirin superfamily)